MKNMTIKALAVSLPFAFGSVMAAEPELLLEETGNLVRMTNVELESVTGGWFKKRKHGHCYGCNKSNKAHVSQVNFSGLSAFVIQGNSSAIKQNN